MVESGIRTVAVVRAWPVASSGAGGWVAVDLGQEIADARGWRELVVAVEAEVAVAPVQRPHVGRLGVAEAGDGEPCPFRAGAFAPGWPASDDRQVPGSDVVLDADLVPGVRGDALFAPAAHAGDVEFGQSGHPVSFPGGG